jgi:hypothetical protein
MADKSNPSGSNNAKPPPRVIGNFTKLGESSRGGGPKLKFTPNMPSKTVVAEATFVIFIDSLYLISSIRLI